MREKCIYAYQYTTCFQRLARVVIPATYKEKVNLELHFFNNCFDNDFSNGE